MVGQKNRKQIMKRAGERNGLTSSQTSQDFTDSFSSTMIEGHHRPSSKSSNGSSKTNQHVHFQTDLSTKSSNNRVIRVRGNHAKRRSKSTKLLLLKRHPDIGFGFTIRGGVEHGTGIFVSNVNKHSDAFVQGLQIGDQILRANNALFDGILHEEAVQYIQHQRILRLIVLSLGVVPGSKIALTEYQWIDCYGAPCSPLKTSGEELRSSSSDSGVNPSRRLLSGEDERKVNVVVGSSTTSLGLLIRGGNEYGLGIFVAGIDQDSVADRSGIMVGEQILEVNGIDFVNITHSDAAEIIRSSHMMTIVLKDVGKIPLARIIYDKTEWIRRKNLIHREAQTKDKSKEFFQQGIAGRLLSHQSLASPISFQWVEEKAHNKLNKDEWATLKYYIREYVRNNLSVNELALSILDLFDTEEKMTLIEEVRGIVRAQDIETFDELMLSMEVAVMKNRSEGRQNDMTVTADISPKLSRDNHFHDDQLEIPHDWNEEEDEENFSPDNNTETENCNFNYETLHEESCHSIIDNMTEETELSQSTSQPFATQNTSNGPRKQQRSLLDEALIGFGNLETVAEDEEDPTYASVNKTTNLTELLKTNLTEYDQQNSPPMEMKTFKSPPNERNVYRNNHPMERGGVFTSPPPQRVEYEEDEEEYGTNKLGFAFSFLNSEENSPQTPQRSSTRSIREESFDAIDTPPQMQSKRLYRDLQNNDKLQQQSANHVIGVDYEKIRNERAQSHSFQNFQPKSLMTSSSPNNSSPNHPDGSRNEKLNSIKVIAGYEHSQNASLNSPTTPTENSQFDLTKTLDKHYSNFSVNDIVRQNFLPTTRVDREPNENESQQPLYNKENLQSSTDTEDNRKRSLPKLNSLNIQNQYQYEEARGSARSLSATSPLSPSTAENNDQSPTMLAPSYLDDNKMYGKPIISPRPPMENSNIPPSVPPPPSFPSYKTKTITDTSISYTKPSTRMTRNKSIDKKENKPDVPWFNIDRLKKTKQGNELLGRDADSTNHTDTDSDQVGTDIIKEMKPSESLGTMSLDIQKLNSPTEEIPKVMKLSPRYTSPRDSSFNTSTELNIIRSSHPSDGEETSVSTLRRRIDSTVVGKKVTSPMENTANDKQTMQAWLKKADMRAKNSARKFDGPNVTSTRETSNNLKSMINVFSQPKEDPMATFETLRKKKRETEGLPGPRVVFIPNTREEPGFTVDVQTNENGESELFVSDIENKSIRTIEIGDVVLRIGDHKFKSGVKKGLANLIIRNKFSSTEDAQVELALK